MGERPKAVYWEDDQSLYVRFEGLTRQRFDNVLRAFKNHIPEAKWFREIGAWKTPKNKMQAVALFAFMNFGDDSLHLLGKAPLQQLDLPF